MVRSSSFNNLAGIGWPIVVAIVVGSTVGEIISDVSQGKKG
jgi:hypothetical protein